jgi:hypothetical protein
MIPPIPIGFVRGVRGVGGLKLKSGNTPVCKSVQEVPTYFFVPLKTTNITNTKNNADESCIVCVRPFSGYSHIAHNAPDCSAKRHGGTVSTIHHDDVRPRPSMSANVRSNRLHLFICHQAPRNLRTALSH